MRAFFLVAAAACSSDGSNLPADLHTIANQPVQGHIRTVEWTLGTRSMNVMGGDLNIALLPDQVADCTKDETNASYPFVILFTPAMPGSYELGQDQFVTFVDQPSSNLIVSHGVVEVDSITPTMVTGGLHVFDSDFGELDGRFDGALCFSN